MVDKNFILKQWGWLSNFWSRFGGRLISRVIDHCIQKIEVFGAPYGLFVLFAVSNLCFVPFIFSNTSGAETPGFIVYLRVLASMISFLLVMRDFWPKSWLRILPLYWYFTLFFCLPYFAITTCLFTSCAIEWVIDLVLTIFILGILVDWKTYFWTLLIGALCAFASFILFADLSQFDPNFGNFPITIYALIISLVAGAMFSRVKERVLMEKLITFQALGGTIAHEMRTPLSAIHISASGLKECLPVLVHGYELAVQENLAVPKISRIALDSVKSSPERMRYICASTLNVIDMLLMQLKHRDWSSHLNNCSIKKCVDIALSEYCFREDEAVLVDATKVKDFKFHGNMYLVVHILYNLMRNAFAFICSEKQGRIFIWTESDDKMCQLHFKDTAKGVSQDDIERLFEHGFSKRSGGSGVGLHYCKKMMHVMGGDISVKSIEGKFTEFILSFPQDNF